MTGLVSIDGSAASKLPDFTALSKQLAKATASSTAMSAYSPSNTVAQACPTVGTDWAASSNLPPAANAALCDCMVSSLSCVANSDISTNDTATLFSTVCGLDNSACAGISANATTGIYGAYYPCSPDQQLSFAFNQYYLSQKKASTACDFNGNAKVQKSSSSSSCSAALGQAGSAGTGTVTAVLSSTATGTSSSSGSASTTSKGAAGAVVVPRLDMGMLQLGAYLVVAGMAGFGMILL